MATEKQDVTPGPRKGFVCKNWWRCGVTLLRASSDFPCLPSRGAQVQNLGIFLMGIFIVLDIEA